MKPEGTLNVPHPDQALLGRRYFRDLLVEREHEKYYNFQVIKGEPKNFVQEYFQKYLEDTQSEGSLYWNLIKDQIEFSVQNITTQEQIEIRNWTHSGIDFNEYSLEEKSGNQNLQENLDYPYPEIPQKELEKIRELAREGIQEELSNLLMIEEIEPARWITLSRSTPYLDNLDKSLNSTIFRMNNLEKLERIAWKVLCGLHDKKILAIHGIYKSHEKIYQLLPLSPIEKKVVIRHSNPEFQENIYPNQEYLPEVLKIQKICFDWKKPIVEELKSQASQENKKSLNLILNHIDPMLPIAWIERNRVCYQWNGFCPELNSFSSTQKIIRSTPDRIFTFRKNPNSSYSMTNINHHKREFYFPEIHSYDPEDSDFYEIHPMGSPEWCKSLLDKMRNSYDWPVSPQPEQRKIFKKVLHRPKQDKIFLEDLEKAIEELIQRIYPDQAVFQECIKHPELDLEQSIQLLHERKEFLPVLGNYPGFFNLLLQERFSEQVYQKHQWPSSPSRLFIKQQNSSHEVVPMANRRIPDLPKRPEKNLAREILKFPPENLTKEKILGYLARNVTSIESGQEQTTHQILKRIPILDPVLNHGEKQKHLIFQTKDIDPQVFRDLNLLFTPETQKIIDFLYTVPIDHIPRDLDEWTMLCNISRISPFSQKIWKNLMGKIRSLEDPYGSQYTIKLQILPTWKILYRTLERSQDLTAQILHTKNQIFTFSRYILENHEFTDIQKFLKKTEQICNQFHFESQKDQREILHIWDTQQPAFLAVSHQVKNKQLKNQNLPEYAKIAWPPLLTKPFIKEPITIRELTSPEEVTIHSREMEHCGASFIQECFYDHENMHFFECEEMLEDHTKTISTLTLIMRSRKQIEIHAIKGFQNAKTSRKLIMTALEMQNHIRNILSDPEWPEYEYHQKRREMQKISSNIDINHPEAQHLILNLQWNIFMKVLPELPDIPGEFFTANLPRPEAI